jgi:RNA polymerase sigma-70 factor, ECF subfamily
MDSDGHDVTVLLNRLTRGHSDRESELLAVIYQELHRLARRHLRRERQGHTLQTTALVNEAYLKLMDQNEVFANRAHFFALASNLMRRVLVDYARQRNRMKRGGGATPEQFDEAFFVSDEKSAEILELDSALDGLAKLEPRQVRVVELRYFGGLTVDEIAGVLQVSPKTVKRDWTVARSWLHRTLSQKQQK